MNRRIFHLGMVLCLLCVPCLFAADNPVDPVEEAGRIRALLAEDDWREALAQAQSLAGDHPGEPEILSVLCEALYRAGRIEEAAERLAPVAAAATAPPRALLTLGLIRSAEGNHAEAAVLANRALEAAPDDPYVMFRGAGFQDSRKKTIEILERFLELSGGSDPDLEEGARGTIRIYRALAEREVWIPRQRPERMELPLGFLPNGRGGVMAYTALVHLGTRKKPLKVLLDTGSPGLFLGSRTARKHGFEPLAEETTFGGGGSGRHRSSRGLFDTFRLGELSYGDALVSTSPRPIDPYKRYRGLLGLAVFEGYRIILDLEGNRLLLEPSEGELDGSPYWVISGQIVIRAGSAAGEASGLFLLDTGANRSLLDLEFAKSLGGASLGKPSRVHGYGGSREGARTVEGAVLSFQGLATDGSRMNAADLSIRSRLSGVEISGFLGLDLLEGATITLDTVQRKVRLEK